MKISNQSYSDYYFKEFVLVGKVIYSKLREQDALIEDKERGLTFGDQKVYFIDILIQDIDGTIFYCPIPLVLFEYKSTLEVNLTSHAHLSKLSYCKEVALIMAKVGNVLRIKDMRVEPEKNSFTVLEED